MTATTTTEPPDYPHCGHGADTEEPVGCQGHLVPRPHPNEGNEAGQERYGACLAHLDEGDRDDYLASLRPGSHLDHHGTTFDADLLRQLLDAVRDPTDGRPHFGVARFDEATFKDNAQFERATFKGNTRFDYATFEGFAWFDDATFKGDTWFNEATFKGDAVFWARFEGNVRFRDARFESNAQFDDARFKGNAQFDDARFKGNARFEGATFTGNAQFDEARFEDNAQFDDARFEGNAQFDEARFKGNARFEGATFEGASHLGPLVCRETVDLTAVVFSKVVTLEIAASRVDCRRTRWASTAALRLRHAAVDFSDAVLEFPVSVAAHPPFAPRRRPVLDESGLTEAPVRVVSLRGVDASHLMLTDVDLSACRFAGTIHLDQLRLHGLCTLATAPTGLHRYGMVPVRWTARHTLAEEQHWRAARVRSGTGWTPQSGDQTLLEPGALAPVYRDLRKGFEDAKNEPGAADFYYGEMEMRRHNPHAPAAERLLLWLYWAASGYGLRASRALGWLLCTMTATVLLMVGFGLPDTPAQPYPPGAHVIGKQNPILRADFPRRFTTARVSKAADVVIDSVVFRSSGQKLTTAGHYTEMASRFTEPILLALALLAVRSRVKR